VEHWSWQVEDAFTVFDQQDSGCLSWGVERDGRRWFVKTARTIEARASLARAAALHAAVRHEALVAPELVVDGLDGATLVYPWRDGRVLNSSTASGSDRSARRRFQARPLRSAERALDRVLDVHLAVAAAGWVTCDLYDGCFLFDDDADVMHLVDLDEYRPGPFVLGTDRLPGSERYTAPEERRRGATIDHRTSVHALGCAVRELLDGPDGWRGNRDQQGLVERATARDPDRRYATVADLVTAWRAAKPGAPEDR
jgi:hypothetical protein